MKRIVLTIWLICLALSIDRYYVGKSRDEYRRLWLDSLDRESAIAKECYGRNR
jgi:hypothetical protein